MTKQAPEQIALDGGLYWGRLYWLYGELPRGSEGGKSFVKDPPTSGWGHAYAIDEGGKMVTLFDPYTLKAFQVPRASYEYEGFERAWGDYRFDEMARLLRDKWAEHQRQGWQSDYGACADVMRRLGLDVPINLLPEGVEARPTGGKEVGEGLIKPVKRKGRRGEVLAFFLEGEGGQRSIHEATAQFGVTRSNLLSQLFLLRKEHGIGYEVAGDAATVRLPQDCDDPFEKETAE